MDDRLNKYILLNDRVGELSEKGLLSLSAKIIPNQFLRGELLESLVEADQPKDPEKIALTCLAKKSSKLECPTSEVAKLTDSEADLLMAVNSAEERFRIYRERNRLEAGKGLSVGDQVLVKVKTLPRDVRGVIWYIGSLPTHSGTIFGIELLSKDAIGHGTTDGTFRNKKYFDCPQDCGVFVGMDKIRPYNDSSSRSQRKERREQTSSSHKSSFPSFSLKGVLPVGLKSKKDNIYPNYSQKLKIDQKVVAFVDDQEQVEGYVRYIAETPEPDGSIPVGIELLERKGRCTGMFKGTQRFVCKEGYGLFAPASTVIPVEDFYGYQQQERLSKSDGMTSMSLGYEVNNGRSSPSRAKVKRSNSITSTSRDEAIVIAGDSKNADPDAVIKQQKNILEAIKAEQGNLAEYDTGHAVEQKMDKNMSFHDEHFNKSPPSTSGNIRVQPGNSQFYAKNSERHYSKPVEVQDPGSEMFFDAPSKMVYDSSSFRTARGSVNHTDTMHTSTLPASSSTSTGLPTTSDRSTARTTPLSTETKIEGTVISTSDGHVQHHMTSKPTNTALDQHVQDNSALAQEDDRLIKDMGLEVGSMVEVPMTNNRSQHGVIRWIGKLPELKNRLVAGLELEEEQVSCNDGMFHGVRYFSCPPGRGFFVTLSNCRHDSRFHVESPGEVHKYNSKAFGSIDSPYIEGTIPPPSSLSVDRRGKMSGIQGHHNSCYLDATLFSMFAFTTVFDSLLYRSKTETDLEDYEQVQSVLKEGIVNPLRSTGFVRADRVLQLRKLLDKLGSTSGLMNEEKDPEEFLNTLLQQVLKSEPLLKLKTPNNHCQESNYYQIITEKDVLLQLPSVQQLVEQSFIFSDLKLNEAPSCMILQMPRFGNKYKMYDIILPNLKLDITHILENVPRECSVCGGVSTFECKECYQTKMLSQQTGISSFCTACNKTWHQHKARLSHKPTPIVVPREYRRLVTEYGDDVPIDKHVMDLFAVVCINTSHYVAFVKCGTDEDAEWCFFDSMADRKGEKNGYNIPYVTACPEASKWLNAKPEDIVSANKKGELPPSMKRLFGDAYMCLYQNLEMTMYK